MSKKPVVPVKRPTKGRGKGNCRGLKKLMKEVDSIAKGLKEVKGFKGGGSDEYYKRIKEFFSKLENIENIKRLKEDLVYEVLETIATEGIEKLMNDKLKNPPYEGWFYAKYFINIITNINDLSNVFYLQSIFKVKEDVFKDISYIDKISTLVMIKMLIEVYNSNGTDNIKTTMINIKVSDTITNLINEIVEEFSNDTITQDKNKLIDLNNRVKKEINDVKKGRDLEIISKFLTTELDPSNVVPLFRAEIMKIIRDLKKKLFDNIEYENKMVAFMNTIILDKGKNFLDTTLNNSLTKYNVVKRDITRILEELQGIISGINTDPLYTRPLFSQTITTTDVIYYKKSTNSSDTDFVLWDALYTKILDCENKVVQLKAKKSELIDILDFFKTFYITKYNKLVDTDIKANDIDPFDNNNVNNEVTTLNIDMKEYNDILDELEVQNKGSSDRVDLDNLISNYDKLENLPIRINNKKKGVFNDIKRMYLKEIEIYLKKYNDYQQYNTDASRPANMATLETLRNEIDSGDFDMLKDFKIKFVKIKDIYETYFSNSKEGGNTGGCKLTTKYISTGNFVYILYEKKKIKRCIYAKAKGRGKYCKIKGDYMLLSKLKVV